MAIWLLGHHVVFAEVPHLIRYQGQVVDSQGIPLEGAYTLTFRLYGVATGGTPVWEEPQTGVLLAQGHFSVLLGQVIPFPQGFDWSQPLWLGVQVNGEAELAPRQRLTSVPLALRAGSAESMKTSGLSDDASRLVPSGAILLWNGANCPTGYARLAALDGKFLVGGTTYNAAAGGSDTKDLSHTHEPGSYTSPAHQHNVPLGKTGSGIHMDSTYGAGDSDSNTLALGGASWNPTPINYVLTKNEGSGAITGTSGTGGSASQDIRPAFATVLLCKKD